MNPSMPAEELRNPFASYTTMYIVNASGGLEKYTDFNNAWGGAMLIWEFLYEKYIGKLTGGMMSESQMKKVWKLVDREDFPVSERAALLSTYDGAMCRREYLLKLADHFTALYQPTLDAYPTHANSLRLQADTMREIYKDQTVQAICWRQTNWCPPGHPPVWPLDYNINTNGTHWFLDDEMSTEPKTEF